MRSTTWTRLGIAALVGAAAAALSFVFTVPGRGEWIALCWLAGFGIGQWLPGPMTWIAGLGGIAGGLLAAVIIGGSLTLVVFGLIALGVVYSHGWGTAWVIHRVRNLGSSAARDIPTLLAGATLLSLVVLSVWLAMELIRNPL